MSKNIKQIRILVACPKDVENIKDLIKEHCETFNIELRKNDEIEFTVHFWKEDIRGLITGERPQEIINKQFDQIECDIFIAIFWKRFGDKQTNGKTPTEEEFDRNYNKAIQNSNPRIVKAYFKEDDINLPNNIDEIAQLSEIIKFKEKVTKLGIYTGFKEKDFVKIFIMELQSFMYRFKKPTSKPEIDKINKYKVVFNHIERKLIGSDNYSKKDLFFSDTYEQSLTEILERELHLVILGDAGSGKTEELNYLANYYSDDKNRLYPIKIELRNYVDQDIEKFIPKEYMKLKDENLILLLDGFDEIESKNKLTFIRRLMLFAKTYTRARIVVTSRTNFYNSELDGFKRYYLPVFNSDDIENYLNEIK